MAAPRISLLADGLNVLASARPHYRTAPVAPAGGDAPFRPRRRRAL
jgi:hypothetical protein